MIQAVHPYGGGPLGYFLDIGWRDAAKKPGIHAYTQQPFIDAKAN
jgi:hypothetical protein